MHASGRSSQTPDPRIPRSFRILGRPKIQPDPGSPDPRIPRSFRILGRPKIQPDPRSFRILGRPEIGGLSEMASPISNSQNSRNSRLASSPRSSSSARPVQRPVTAMVPYRACAIELRSRRYNLAATRMRNINIRIGALNEIILEVYGLAVDLPKFFRGNIYEEPGNPPSMRRISNSESGFERIYNRMMRSGKKNEHTRSIRNNKYTTLFGHTDYIDRGINLKHAGALRYVVQQSIKNKLVIVNEFGGVGIAFGFSRKARVKINKPKDLEGIIDLRYTAEDEKRDNDLVMKEKAEEDAQTKNMPPAPSDRTMLTFRDCLITFEQVTTITSTGGASASNLNIADAPAVNCLIAGFYSRLALTKNQIEEELKLLPVQRKGRPRAGEIRDAKSAEERTRLSRELKNVTRRVDDLLVLNERVQVLGGIKHSNIHIMKEIIQLSGANSLTIISPLYPKFGSYLHVDNPNPITGKVHGVIKTPIKMLLTTPTHVEAFTASTFGFITSDSEVVKLDVAEMTAKHAELQQTDTTLITYPSNSYSFPQRILRGDGTVYALQTPFNLWSDEMWKPQIKRATMNSAEIGPDVFCACIQAVLLTGRCRFELYDTFPRGEQEDKEVELEGKDVALRQKKPRILAEDIINVDQSKAYTRAFDPCMTPFLANPGCCIGKINEVFTLSSHDEMRDMLSQKIEADKIFETLTNVYTTKIARSYEVDDRGFYKLQAPAVSKILTFPEARFWLMCGVTFEAHLAMVSFDSVPTSWDETSYTKENGIRHYAKAVGIGMSTRLSSRFHMCGSEVQAQQYFALALEDPNLDETRVHIRTLGENTIEIEHPLGGVNTTAHVSAYITACQRVQAVCQAFVLPA
ncbi:hypothetical protein T492DRAFT_841000 [Pavlovales sp. CCMP2436]|nr:hypothetical protein T492DRAFT_841000 [Pavlovales sp. CCMP2436]